MNQQSAQWILSGVAAVGFLVWFGGLAFLIATVRADRPLAENVPERFSPESEPIRPDWITGGAEVPGSANDLSERLVEVLAQPMKAGFPIKILEHSGSFVRFEILGIGPVGAGTGRPRPGWFHLKPMAVDRTWVGYATEGIGGRWMLAVAGLFLVLGLAALVGGFWTCQTYLLPDPTRRLQVIQMVQMVHFLWPPFLFIGLYRTRRRLVQRGFDLLVANLPYL